MPFTNRAYALLQRLLAPLVFFVTNGCDSSHVDIPPPSPEVAKTLPSITPKPALPLATAPPPPALRPLQSRYALISLSVPDYGEAIVSLPLNTTTKRPIVVATHGNYDRPEWQCEVWREIIGGDRTFILCPRGIQRPDSPSVSDIRFTYESNQILEKEIDAALYALRKQYGDYLDDGPILYTGFSLGAIQGVSIAGRNPKQARRLVLVEGGHSAWKPEVVKAFADEGNGRVLFICSQPDCEKDANWAIARLNKAGVATKLVKIKNVGHRYDGPVADATKNALPWILAGDSRFGVNP